MTGNAGASKPSVSAVWARWMDEDGEDCHRWRRSYDSCGGWRRKSWHSTASSTCGRKKERKKREKQERIMTGGRRPDRTEVASVDDDEACELEHEPPKDCVVVLLLVNEKQDTFFNEVGWVILISVLDGNVPSFRLVRG
ncbi:hypothetical protein OsI_37861 [Oryza sativa Indica Group]|uniref:Uncharacterized protein n=1 Tax=Oryza sativa subsp. indica TaxID=39946 RepID=B8BNP9_ORYSI|nr:hypothetical protein OsI_37861 [Oryza sativa Indica Group]